MTLPLVDDMKIVVPDVTEVDVGSASTVVVPTADAYDLATHASDRQPPPPYVPSASNSGVYRPGLGG